MACNEPEGAHGLRLRQLHVRLCSHGKRRGCKSSAKVAVAHELSKLVHVVWSKPVGVYRFAVAAARQPRRATSTQEETLTVKTTLHSDQPRPPMVRRRATVGQTRL